MKLPRSFVGIPIIALSLCALAGPAAAGRIHASPAHVQLGPELRTSVVSIVNQGSDALVLQVKAFEWGDDVHGHAALTPTSDLTVSPMMLLLAPGETRRVRVGFPPASMAEEGTYRLVIEELTSSRVVAAEEDAERGTARVRTSVPVFVQPADAPSSAEVGAVRCESGNLRFEVRNVGRSYFKAAKIRAHLELESGPQDIDFDGWYVLGGGSRSFSVALPRGACPRRAVIRIETDAAGVVERTVELARAGSP